MNPTLPAITIETKQLEAYPHGDVHRWHCACGRYGVWLTSNADAQRHGFVHLRHEHQVTYDRAERGESNRP